MIDIEAKERTKSVTISLPGSSVDANEGEVELRSRRETDAMAYLGENYSEIGGCNRRYTYVIGW